MSFHALLVLLACFAATAYCTTIPKAASGWTMGRGSASGVAKVRGLKPYLTTFSVKRVMRKTRAQHNRKRVKVDFKALTSRIVRHKHRSSCVHSTALRMAKRVLGQHLPQRPHAARTIRKSRLSPSPSCIQPLWTACSVGHLSSADAAMHPPWAAQPYARAMSVLEHGLQIACKVACAYKVPARPEPCRLWGVWCFVTRDEVLMTVRCAAGKLGQFAIGHIEAPRFRKIQKPFCLFQHDLLAHKLA